MPAAEDSTALAQSRAVLAMASLNTYTFKLLGGDESKYTRDVDDVAAQQLAKEKAAEKKAEKDKEEKRRKETEEFETAARAAILAELQEVIDELDTPEKAAELARLIKPKGDLMIKKFRDDALYDLEETHYDNASRGLAARFPAVAAACSESWGPIDRAEHVSLVRSLLVREGVMSPSLLCKRHRLRVEGV